MNDLNPLKVKQMKNFKGFTLLEIILSIAILTILTIAGFMAIERNLESSDKRIESNNMNNSKIGETNSKGSQEDVCVYDECLFNGYFVIYATGTSTSYKNGCQSEKLINNSDKCILKIGDMYVAPSSTEISTTHWNYDLGNNGADLYDDSDLNGATQKTAISDGNYGLAAEHCAQLSIDLFDWELPSMGSTDSMGKEVSLQQGVGNGGLADFFAAFDNNLIEGQEKRGYWSSTYYGQTEDSPGWWIRSFDSGDALYKPYGFSGIVRCVAKKK